MKKIISSLFFVLAANCSQAEGILDDAIFGISLVNQDVNLVVNISGGTVNVDESGMGFGIYLDKYYNGKYRVNSTLSYVAYDLFDLAELSLSADYLVPLNKTISLFAGLSAGSGMQKYADASISDASFDMIYGVEIGGIVYVDRTLMMELGYRQKKSNIETKVISLGGTSVLLDEISELYLSFLLMF